MPAARIFVSHSHEDNEWCRPFVTSLEAVGYDVWYDELGLHGGADWIRTLEQKIEMCDIFLLVLTPDANTSDWVQSEIRLALAAHRRIIPLMLKLVALEGFLRTIQAINATDQDRLAAVRRVIVAVEQGESNATASPAPSESPDILPRQAWELRTECQYDEALELATRALALDPENSINWATKAEMLHMLGDNMGAISAFRRCIMLDPEDLEAMRQLFYRLHDEGRTGEADRLLRHIVQIDPNEEDELRNYAEWISGENSDEGEGDRW